MALLQLTPRPDREALPRPAGQLRRCTYRRLVRVDPGEHGLYDVECLYPDRLVPIPLGDLGTARPICNACSAAHVFRPDED